MQHRAKGSLRLHGDVRDGWLDLCDIQLLLDRFQYVEYEWICSHAFSGCEFQYYSPGISTVPTLRGRTFLTVGGVCLKVQGQSLIFSLERFSSHSAILEVLGHCDRTFDDAVRYASERGYVWTVTLRRASRPCISRALCRVFASCLPIRQAV